MQETTHAALHNENAQSASYDTDSANPYSIISDQYSAGKLNPAQAESEVSPARQQEGINRFGVSPTCSQAFKYGCSIMQIQPLLNLDHFD